MMAAPEHTPNLFSTLQALLGEYAAILDGLGDTLEPGVAGRFRQCVLTPITDAAMLGTPRSAIPALLAALEFTPERLTIRRHPTPAELAKLRDRLGQFEQELRELPPPKTRWISGSSDPHLTVTPDVRQLIADCRTAFARLAIPLPPGTSERLERLQTLEVEIRTLLETAPLDWPPAAPMRVQTFLNLTSEPFARSLTQIQNQLFGSLLGRDDPATVAITIADRLIELANPDPRRLAWLDQVFGTLRGWGCGVGIRFLPANWSFSASPTVDTLDTDGVELVPVYKQDLPKGVPVRVKVLGVATGETILRPAIVPLSAGPVPNGLAELEDELHDLNGPIVDTLRGQLLSWRAASLKGIFESAAVDTFVHFWDELSQPLREEQPERVDAITRNLALVMTASLGYTLLEPTHFLDCPEGWVQIAEGRLTSGRVRRVLRPGLSDADRKLRTPAVVEVE